MGVINVITDENGTEIITDTGDAIIISTPSQNADIQLFDFSVDLLKAILWQYDSAPNLIELLEAKNQWYETNQQQFWESWVTDVFDLRTANEFGLAVWSIILGLPLFVNVKNDGPFFGFDDQTGINFDNGIFGDQNTFDLPLDIKRLALRLRYFQLTSAGTVPEVNRMLKYLFADFGTAWLLDFHDMTQRYVFNFPIPYGMQYLFNHFDILPRPAGVASTYTDSTQQFFGFAVGDDNFDNGIFGD